MATKEALDALQKTDRALQDIRTKLQPFLATLESHADHNNNSNNNNHKKPTRSLALSQTAVALSLGTLRFMGARLRGQGSKADDPVRKELNHMRKLLVTLQQQQQGKKAKSHQTGTQSQQAKQKVKAQAAVKAPAVVNETAAEPVSSPATTTAAEASPKSGSKRKESSSSSKEASKRRSRTKR
jgi:hypothetical protein